MDIYLLKIITSLWNSRDYSHPTWYAPPHSKGLSPKNYIYTVYALSTTLQLSVSPDKVNREVLLAAMKEK